MQYTFRGNTGALDGIVRIIGGKYRGARLASPTSTKTRPTSDRRREILFNILLHNAAVGMGSLEGKRVVDVFAGTGAVGLEAYSRGAESVVFIEKNKDVLPVLEENIKKFSLPASCILKKDALFVGKASAPFDFVFLDPPYAKGLIPKTLMHLFLKGWFSVGSVVVLESGKEEKIPLPPFLEFCVERCDGISALTFCKVIPFEETLYPPSEEKRLRRKPGARRDKGFTETSGESKDPVTL